MFNFYESIYHNEWLSNTISVDILGLPLVGRYQPSRHGIHLTTDRVFSVVSPLLCTFRVWHFKTCRKKGVKRGTRPTGNMNTVASFHVMEFSLVRIIDGETPVTLRRNSTTPIPSRWPQAMHYAGPENEHSG